MKRLRASSHKLRQFGLTVERTCAGGICLVFIFTFNSSTSRLEAPGVPPSQNEQSVAQSPPDDRADLFALITQANAARTHWLEKSFRDAIRDYEEVVRLSRSRSQFDLAAEAASSAAEVHFILSEYNQSLQRYEEARSLRRLSRNKPEEMRALGRVGQVNVYLGKAQKGLSICLQVIDYFRRSHSSADPNVRAEAQNCAGEANYSLSKHKQSIVFFEQAQTLWQQANDTDGQALASRNLGYAYTDLGDPHKGEAAFKRSLALYSETNNKRGEALALTGLGSTHSLIGNKQAALDHHTKAIELLRVVGDHAGEAVALNSTAQVYEDLNKLQTALDNYSRALDIYRQLGNIEFASVTKYYMGRTYKALKNNPKALELFTACVTESKPINNPRLTAYCLTAISSIRRTEGLVGEAQSQLKTALRLFRRLGDRIGQGNAQLELGHIYRGLDRQREAFGAYSSALKLYQAAGDYIGQTESLYYSAVSQNAIGHVDEALAWIKQSNQLVESVRGQIISPELRSSYFASVHKHAELYIDLLMKSPDSLGKAFEVSEKTHSRSLLEVLGEASAQIRKGADQQLLDQERSLQQALRAKTLYRMRLLDGPSNQAELTQVDADIREITRAYNALQTRIKQQSEDYGNLVQPQPLDLRGVQANLESDTLLLEFSLGVDRSYLWSITNQSMQAYPLPGRNELESSVELLGNLLKARETISDEDPVWYEKQVAQADAEYWREAARLSKTLLGPVIGLSESKRLVIVADGALHYLPFEALPQPSTEASLQVSDEPLPLMLAHEVVILPSASILGQIRRARGNGEQQTKLITVLADPVFSVTDPRVDECARRQVPAETDDKSPIRLEATLREADEIMSVTPSAEGHTFVGFAANRQKALSELGHYRIAHLATHAFVDTENPELSGIMFSQVTPQGQKQDGFLQLPEIYNLSLEHTRLVVLSACETGFGKDVRGEGLVSLSRGFIYAGAHSVIGSLWKVDDAATAQLMTKFYEGMFKQELTPSAALREAKESMWRSGRYRAPFYWAAFVLQGEYRDRIEMPPARKYSFWLLLLPISILSLGLYVLLRVRRRR
jgi:CHAT domain-containing protein